MRFQFCLADVVAKTDYCFTPVFTKMRLSKYILILKREVHTTFFLRRLLVNTTHSWQLPSRIVVVSVVWGRLWKRYCQRKLHMELMFRVKRDDDSYISLTEEVLHGLHNQAATPGTYSVDFCFLFILKYYVTVPSWFLKKSCALERI